MRSCALWGPCVLLALFAAPSLAQSPEPLPMAYKAAATAALGNSPVLPSCATVAVQDGDPGKGPSIFLIKAQKGCVFPWHWHTPNEKLIILSGSAKGEMKDAATPLALKPGDFVVLPSKGIHQFTAVTAVELYDISDAPFDMHYVDSGGQEIAVADALKAVHEAPAASK